MERKSLYLKIAIFIIFLLIIVNIVTISIFSKNKEEPNIDLCFYENDNNYVLVEKNTLGESITSYLYKDSHDNYLSKIYEYGTENELKIEDLIKEEKIDTYNNKINELIKLKYPKFVADTLINNEIDKSYILRDNELVIYFNNVETNPQVEELLYLKVNYNEIKDCINFTASLDKDYQNESGYDYTNAKKSVAITFDDSPNKNKTDRILASLQDNHFHATFFIVGERAVYNKDLLINIKNSGNEIGSHTYHHQNMKKLSDEEVISDFQNMNEFYQSIFNENMNLIRPPYGSINESQQSLLDASYILWSLDTNDWRYRSSDYLVNYVIDNIKDGDIILFHDAYDSSASAIEELLPILYSKGYQVMSVSELFKLKNIPLEKNKIYYNVR